MRVQAQPDPQALLCLQGTLDKDSGKIEMEFYAQFSASLAGLYHVSRLTASLYSM